MSEKKNVELTSEEMIAKAKDFWSRNNKPVMIVCAVIILLGGGWLVYKNFFKAPKEAKATEAMFKAEEYFRMDSINLALNGDGQSMGFLRVMNRFSGTKAANMANYYAGACYLKTDDYANAAKYLKKFSTSSKPVQARAYLLLGDAYAGLGQNSDALSSYKKAAHHFEKDRTTSSNALFTAALFAHKVMKDRKEAIDLFQELNDKYPREKGYEANLYLGQLGVYTSQ